MAIQWTEELELEICDAISKSEIGIRRLCALNPHWPHPATIMRYILENKRFCELYARAKFVQMQLMAEDSIDISDDASRDTVLKKRFDGEVEEAPDNEWINRTRLRVDTRKWYTAKLCPRIFGEGFLRKIPYRIDLQKPLDVLGQEILDKAADGLLTQDEALYNFEILKKYAELSKIPEIEKSLKEMMTQLASEQNLPSHGVITNANEKRKIELDQGSDQTSRRFKKKSRRKKRKKHSRKKATRSSQVKKSQNGQKGATGDDVEKT